MNIVVCTEQNQWLHALETAWQEIGGDALSQRGTFHLGLSSGSLSGRLCHHLARAAWPWSATRIFITDEACLPPDHPESTYHTLYSAFYPVKPTLHRWSTELSDFQRAVTEYEHLLKRETGSPPKLDLVILSAEPQHMAELLLNSANPAADPTSACALVNLPHSPLRRLIMTPPVISRARAVWILSEGPEQKQTALSLSALPALQRTETSPHPASRPIRIFHLD